MEFDFDIRKVLQNELTRLRPDMPMFRSGPASSCSTELADVIDKMGESSAKAQRLPQIVTNFRRFRNSNHSLFILADLSENRILGILKSGRKRLFIHDKDGVCVETEPVCVLDFYVHESKQRQGCGRKLFDRMLHDECVSPRAVAIDSPSAKMLQFLQKHYGLTNPVFASNSYVIFPGFFEQQNIATSVHRFSPTESATAAAPYDQPSILPNPPVATEQRSYSLPHTRVQTMPTKMTVIKPHVDEDKNNCQQTEKMASSPPRSRKDSDIRPLNSKPQLTPPQESSHDHKSTNDSPAASQKNPRTKMRNDGFQGSSIKINYPILSQSQLSIIRSMPSSSRNRGTYSYINAVRHHNGHTRLW
ncbi:Alpha-tubulin N-acetyltransferase [Fasciola hepatica]|uniref:Alpha-tubulin N-acetyltransferase n=1 Tax=Fasciola hepatica TaxID=6192 RepID=A0A4E0RDR0_FASHE|nr:Alpha-tubulin N-acetyltransferase [Fasciola hepatica]